MADEALGPGGEPDLRTAAAGAAAPRQSQSPVVLPAVAVAAAGGPGRVMTHGTDAPRGRLERREETRPRFLVCVVVHAGRRAYRIPRTRSRNCTGCRARRGPAHIGDSDPALPPGASTAAGPWLGRADRTGDSRSWTVAWTDQTVHLSIRPRGRPPSKRGTPRSGGNTRAVDDRFGRFSSKVQRRPIVVQRQYWTVHRMASPSGATR